MPAALQGSAEPGFPCAWGVGRGWIPALPSSRWISGRLGHGSLWIGARGVMSIPRPGMEGLLRVWVSVPSSLPGTREFPMELSPPGCSLSPWAMQRARRALTRTMVLTLVMMSQLSLVVQNCLAGPSWHKLQVACSLPSVNILEGGFKPWCQAGMCRALQEGELLLGWFLQPSCAAEQGGCGRSMGR